MKTISTLIMAAFAAATLAPAVAMAANDPSQDQGYLVDSRGTIVTSGTPGVCWNASATAPDRTVEECGQLSTPVAAVAPAPQPAVVAAAPVSAPAQVVAAPLPQKISFSGDALFAFDQSELTAQGKTMLDGMVNKLDGATYDTILATGHTDRLGSNAYNQKLSERRANTVKDYLMSKNVPARRIDAQGKGETQPINHADACRGMKRTSVVSCLQPDRRVDVEMKGTKTVVGSL
jgi:OOP family OmpA-OmpF porin